MTSINLLSKPGFKIYDRVRAKAQKAFEYVRLEIMASRLVSAQLLSDEDFLAFFDLEDVSTLLAQGDVPAAKAALLDYYDRRVASGWPACPTVLPDLDLDIGALSQEELSHQADAALECPFPHSEAFLKMDSAGKIDWRYNPTSYQEWLWMLNRHEWWALFAMAYARTGDERYANAFVSQMIDWVQSNPPPPRKDEKSPTWRLMEIGLRLGTSWIPAFGLFYSSRPFTDEAKLMMLRAIYDHARFLFLFKTNRNHLLRESNGLAYVSTTFPEFKEAKLWQRKALARLDQELSKQINQDGSHIELSTGYQWLVTDEFEKTHDLLEKHGLSLPVEDLTGRLEKMYQVLASLVRPDGTFPQINDGFIHWPVTRLAQAGAKLGRDDFVYVGTTGNQGVPPKNRSVGIDDAGLYVMRSDWTEDARYLLFDSGPYGGPHGHEDKLSIELYAFGQSFIVDCGSYTYDKADPFRTYFVGSQSHNTILVDGQSQVRRWQKENLDPKTAVGNYATWISRPDFDYVAASYSDGYSVFEFKPPQDARTIKDVTHTRHILFVKPDYWVIVDELEATHPHDYQLLFHAAPEIGVTLVSGKKVVLASKPDAARLYLVPADPQSVQVNSFAGSQEPIQGWYSAEHEVKVPINTIVYEATKAALMRMATLLYPCSPGQTADEVNLMPLTLTKGEGMGFVVTTPHGRDYLVFSQDPGTKQFGSYQATGIVAGVRTDNKGTILLQFEGS